MILVNFKRFEGAMGQGAVKLAKICKKIAKETGIEIYPVVRVIDAYRVMEEAKTKVYLQKPEEGESETEGVLLNHSDYRLKPGTIKNWLKKIAGQRTILCLQSLGQVQRWARKLKPTFFAFEPRELIGNREKSVASEYKITVEKMVKLISPTPLLVGAGIHCREDVLVARKAGAVGILVATDIVKAEDPEKELRELAEAFSV